MAQPASVPAHPPRFSRPDDIFQVLVTLEGIQPPVWRRLLVPQDLILPRLHAVLQAAMGWTDSHLHLFEVGDVVFGQPDPDFDSLPTIDERRITLHQLLPRRGSRCVYEYDFGDGWRHSVEVEDELAAETVAGGVPRVVEGARACPPENCGGIGGYADLVDALRDPRHPDHPGYRAWARDFDPEAFDLAAVNRVLNSTIRRWTVGPTPRRPSSRH